MGPHGDRSSERLGLPNNNELVRWVRQRDARGSTESVPEYNTQLIRPCWTTCWKMVTSLLDAWRGDRYLVWWWFYYGLRIGIIDLVNMRCLLFGKCQRLCGVSMDLEFGDSERICLFFLSSRSVEHFLFFFVFVYDK